MDQASNLMRGENVQGAFACAAIIITRVERAFFGDAHGLHLILLTGEGAKGSLP